jgi:ELWxxDGT repeat protein
VKDIAHEGNDSSNPEPWTVMDGIAYLDASDGELPGDHGDEMWRSNGRADGTWMVKDIDPGVGNGFARFQTRLGHRILFIANDGTSDLELFVSDGTRNGTHLVKDINEESGEGGIIGYPGGGPDLAVFEGRLYFQANDGTGGGPGDHGPELWRSDGTAAGTRLFKELVPGTAGTQIQWFRRVGQKLFFGARDPKGMELWVTDGTTAGTHRVKDIWPGAVSSDPSPLGVIGSILYFSAESIAHGRELWRSDGTRDGTRMVKDIFGGHDGSFPNGGRVVGGVLVFVAENAKGAELWRSNGTAAGTKLVKDLRQGPEGSDPSSLTRVGQRLIFFADDGINGREPWTYVP